MSTVVQYYRRRTSAKNENIRVYLCARISECIYGHWLQPVLRLAGIRKSGLLDPCLGDSRGESPCSDLFERVAQVLVMGAQEDHRQMSARFEQK